MMKFSKNYVNGLCNNITVNERTNWKRIPYLWKNMSKQYFNPFHKGSSWKNFREVIESFIDPFIPDSAAIQTGELASNKPIKLNLSLGEEKKLIDEASNKGSDPEAQLNTKHISEISFTSKCKSCYYAHFTGDNETLINWTKLRIYSLVDLLNSPMKSIIEENLRIQDQQQKQRLEHQRAQLEKEKQEKLIPPVPTPIEIKTHQGESN